MKTSAVILLFFLSPLFSFSQKTDRSVIDKDIEAAKKLSESNPKKAMEFSEQIYHLSKNSGYKTGILESSNILMMRYFDAGNFKKILELSREAENIAIEQNDKRTLSNIYRLRGMAYTEIGFHDESVKEFKKAFAITRKINEHNFRNYQDALLYNGLASYHAHYNSPIDSVIFYQKKSMETATKINNSEDYLNKKYFTLALAYINLGKTSSQSQRFEDAENYFRKALEICRNKKYSINDNLKIAVLNEFAWLYYEQNNYADAVDFAEQAEISEKKQSTPYLRRDIYEVHFKSAVEQGNKEESNRYMSLFTALNDSIVNIEKKIVATPLEYIKENQQQAYHSKIRIIVIVSTAIVIASLIFGFLYWKTQQISLQKRYDIIIADLKTEYDEKDKIIQSANFEKSENPIKGITIIDNTQNAILQKLEEFEADENFIRNDVSLASLANSMNTNTRYLSEIIKKGKGKSFNDYINGLRIRYIIEILYKKPAYRQYKISYLAECSGFSSREVFTVIFKKETGVNPSYFIDKLRKEQEKVKV